MEEISMIRSNLAKKLVCSCPVCQTKIYGGNLGLNDIDIRQINSFPFGYTYIHKHQDSEHPHAITIYFDADLKVRGIESSSMFKMDL